MLFAVERGEAAAETGSGLDALVLYLPAERGDPVREFVTERVATCPYCGAEVRRNSARGLDADERLGHLGCVTAVVGTCPVCRRDVTRKHKHSVLPNGGVADRECAEKKRR